MTTFLGFCAFLFLVWLLSGQVVPGTTTARITAKCWPCDMDYTSEAFEALHENEVAPLHNLNGLIVEVRDCSGCGQPVGRKVIQ